MKSIMDTFFATGSNINAAFEANLLNNMPSITGTVTIKNMLSTILIKETFPELAKPNKSKVAKTIKGMVRTDSRLIIAVRDIERATSPFANAVNI